MTERQVKEQYFTKNGVRVVRVEMGRKIKSIRGRVSQKEFAAHIGVRQGTLSRYERGQFTPDIEVLSKIAAYGGTTVIALLAPTWDGVERRKDVALRTLIDEAIRLLRTSAPFRKALQEMVEFIQGIRA